MVIPYLLLPSATILDLPVVPPINKTTMANITLLLLVLFAAREKEPLLPSSLSVRLLLAMAFTAPFLTALQNSDPLLFPQGWVPAMSFYDALSSTIQLLLMIVPFFVGRAYLSSPTGHREIAVVFLASALFYSAPMLLELRLSPQLHNWIYGFHQHSFSQQIRGGGFRPVVFLSHGLMVALYVVFAVAAAAILWRQRNQERERERSGLFFVALAYLLVVLVLCKSLASLLYAVVILTALLLFGVRTQLRLAVLLAFITVAYPALRSLDVIPVNEMLDLARQVNEDRANSLQFRFDNESALLERASERPSFGWGSWGRYHIHHPITGEETSIADGYWIITLGTFGWFGFLAIFGLLAVPLMSIWRGMQRMNANTISYATSGLSLILATNMIDLLPNASIVPITWLIAGSLLGYAERISVSSAEDLPGRKRSTSLPKRRTVL